MSEMAGPAPAQRFGSTALNDVLILRKLSAGGDIGAATAQGIVQLAAAEYVRGKVERKQRYTCR